MVPSTFDHDHRTIIQVTDTLALLFTWFDDPYVKVFARQIDRL